MRRVSRGWVTVFMVVAVAASGLIAGSELAAQPQQQHQGKGSGGFAMTEATGEIAPRLLAGPKGEIIRISHRRQDLAAGGSSVAVAMAGPQNTWQPLVEIVPAKGVSALSPTAAIGPAGEIAIVYQWRRNTPRSKQIRLARSDDGGKTWIQPSVPIDSTESGFAPKVAWGKGKTLVVVWDDERRSSRGWDVYARRSLDGGATWEAEQKVSVFSDQSLADLNARAGLYSDGGDRFWIVWVGILNGRSRLFLSRSVDGARTWSDPKELSGDSQSVMFTLDFVQAGDRLLTAWSDRRSGRERVYTVSSSDGGATWSAPKRVDHLPADSPAEAFAPTIAMTPAGEAFVAWNDSRHGRYDVFFSRSTDGGVTWGESIRLDNDEPGTAISMAPRIALAPDGTVAAVWDDDRAGHHGVYLRVRPPGAGSTFGPEIVVAPPTPKQAARLPQLLWTKDKTLQVAWEVWDFTLGPLAIARSIDGKVVTFDKK